MSVLERLVAAAVSQEEDNEEHCAQQGRDDNDQVRSVGINTSR